MGFGDSLPHQGFLGTNVTKLLQTSRSDGILLKPAHTALRLDVAPPIPNGSPRQGFKPLEVWAAASVPARPSVAGYARSSAAGLRSAATDRRANSLARLAHVNGSTNIAERWWYTLLATDTSSGHVPSPCAPVSHDGQGKIMMAECAEESMLQLKTDGSLRATGAPNLCVVAGPAGGPELAVGAKDCVTFSKLRADGTLRSGSKCLGNRGGVLILDSCTSVVDADGSTSAIEWTMTDSVSGSYIEYGSNKPVRITLSKAAEGGNMMDITFVPGMYQPHHR
eukprot:COSAG02_NODE_2323_length_9134_cov_28.189928_8_plen_280_part_00